MIKLFLLAGTIGLSITGLFFAEDVSFSNSGNKDAYTMVAQVAIEEEKKEQPSDIKEKQIVYNSQDKKDNKLIENKLSTRNEVHEKQDVVNLSDTSSRESSNKKTIPNEEIEPVIKPSPTKPSCQFLTNQTPQRKDIILNEVAWMGTTEHAGNEWIELTNRLYTEVDITGWQLFDRSEQIRVVFGFDQKISRNGFYILERSTDMTIPHVIGGLIYTGAISNNNEGLRLFDENCVLQDEVLASQTWSAGNNKEKRTMERNYRTLEWYTSSVINGTPGAKNSTPFVPPLPPPTLSEPPVVKPPPTPPPPPPEPTITIEPVSPPPPSAIKPLLLVPPPPTNGSNEANHIVISEVFIDMEGSDDEEFIEIYNPTSQVIDISNWSLQYISGSASSFDSISKKNFITAILNPGQFFLIGVGGYSGTTTPDMTWSQSLNNTGATIFLVDDQSKIDDENNPSVIGRVGYGSGSGVFVPENGAALLPSQGESIERKAWEDACVSAQGVGELLGNNCDADDNSTDFEIRAIPNPQNTASNVEL